MPALSVVIDEVGGRCSCSWSLLDALRLVVWRGLFADNEVSSVMLAPFGAMDVLSSRPRWSMLSRRRSPLARAYRSGPLSSSLLSPSNSSSLTSLLALLLQSFFVPLALLPLFLFPDSSPSLPPFSAPLVVASRTTRGTNGCSFNSCSSTSFQLHLACFFVHPIHAVRFFRQSICSRRHRSHGGWTRSPRLSCSIRSIMSALNGPLSSKRSGGGGLVYGKREVGV